MSQSIVRTTDHRFGVWLERDRRWATLPSRMRRGTDIACEMYPAIVHGDELRRIGEACHVGVVPTCDIEARKVV